MALGFPAGGLGLKNRVLLYLGDSWKIKSNFTLTYGLRYERDTGRTDSQDAAIPQLGALLPGLGNAVNQPNKNFGPDLGFAGIRRKTVRLPSGAESACSGKMPSGTTYYLTGPTASLRVPSRSSPDPVPLQDNRLLCKLRPVPSTRARPFAVLRQEDSH